MPRGIAPVVALLIIASLTQFGGSPAPSVLGSAMQASQASLVGAPVAGSERRPASASAATDLCKDFTPCMPRADLGPWVASCRFVRARQISIEPSPMVVLDLSRPVSGKLPVIANNGNMVDPAKLHDASPGDADSVGRWCLKEPGIVVTAVIVTLPDPVNSHLALDFDRRIDSIEAAALDAQFVLDKFWLPWETTESISIEDSTKANKDRVLQRLRQNQPGLQIFRPRDPKASEAPRALFVFLVSETPTLGINLVQLDNAIDYVREVQNAGDQSSRTPLRILGPGFSGSIPALAEALQQKIKNNTCCFNIIPSSATDQKLREALQDAVPAPNSVSSVLHDDAAALERLLQYTEHDLKIPAEEVAIVSESQTAYGGGFIEEAPFEEAPKDGSAHNNPHRAVTRSERTLRLSFPREIYRLRAAYPDQQRVSAGSARVDTAPSSGLTLNLKSFSGREDNIPSFSREQLPLSQEALMLSIAETIHRRKIKMVGVVASDVFDSLFVLRFFQEFSPDVRLFILDSDLLFIRAVDNLSLEGALAVTDYPLSSSVQSWQGEEKTLRTFPSRNAEVTYNAFLALVGKPEVMRDYTQDPEAPRPEPHLWLTVVSRNGFQPVHLLSPLQDEPDALPFVNTANAGQNPATNKPPGKLQIKLDFPSGSYLSLCALLLGLTISQLVMTSIARHPTVPFLGWLLEFLHICEDSDAHTQKAYLLANSFIILAVLDFIVFLPIWQRSYLLPCDGFRSIWYLVLSALSLGAVIASIAAALSLTSTYGVFRRNQGLWPPEAKWLALSWVIAFCYFAVWGVFTLRPGADSKFFLYRSLDLASGSSPLLPHLLLFIAFYLWSLSNLRRVHYWETRREDLDFVSIDTQFRSHFNELGYDLNTALGKMFFTEKSWIILFLVLAILVLLRPFSHIASLEAFHLLWWNLFDLIYVLYLLLFTAFLTHSLLRFVMCWAALLKVLRRMERQPIRHAFDRLPKKSYSWTPLWHAGGARRSYSLQARALDCLRKLCSVGKAPPLSPHLAKDLPGLVKQLQASTSRLLDAEAAGYLDQQAENELSKANLIATADRIADDFLIPHWLATGDTESVEHHEKKEAEKADDGVRYLTCAAPPDGKDVYLVAEEFVALRFVAFMRYIGVQLRNLLSFIGVGFILCVASVRSYPFLAHRAIGWALTLIFIALGVPVVIAFAQMDKDAILSRLSDTEPGKLDSAFYLRLVSYGALPLLTVLASQFPSIGRFLFSWVQPAIEALH